MDLADFDLAAGVGLGGHISFRPLGVPLFCLKCEQWWHLYTTLFFIDV
jgi:hypothetical protein